MSNTTKMDAIEMVAELEARIVELNQEYRCYVNGTNLQGEAVAKGTAATQRNLTKRDIEIVSLVVDLLKGRKEVMLSDAGVDGLDRLTGAKAHVKKEKDPMDVIDENTTYIGYVTSHPKLNLDQIQTRAAKAGFVFNLQTGKAVRL